MKKFTAGFSLAEILVVVAVISILASVLYVNFGDSQAQARDVQRQADLRELQSAIEMYKNRYGRYPAGCNATGWSSQVGGPHPCSGGDSQYIVGLAPEFISALPTDPKLNGTNSGYAYLVNGNGTVYKLVALRTVEEMSVADALSPTRLNEELREFRYCDFFGYDPVPGNLCENVVSYSNVTPPHCAFDSQIFQTSYAMWGGYDNSESGTTRENRTEDIICGSP
jgi:prepilin-type N-terminal cleavage/methylation domain-containing protein